MNLPFASIARGSAAPRDELGRVYTPLPLAAAMVAAVPELGDAPLVVEPSVGSGNVLREVLRRWPGAHAVGVDVDPATEGFALCGEAVRADWPTAVRSGWIPGRPDLVIGNPPFGRSVGIQVTIDHVLAGLELRPRHQLLVLPCAYVSGAEFDRVFRVQRPAKIHRLLERPWPDRVREVVVFHWSDGHSGPTELVDLAGWP